MRGTLAIACAIVGLAACSQPVDIGGPIVGSAVIGATPDGGNHHLLEEGVQFEGDLVGVDRLDILMNPEDDSEGGWVARCEHMGGRVPDPPVDPICEDVDF